MARPDLRSREWAELRSRVIVRDGGVCMIRGPRCRVAATTADHVVPVALGGTSSMDNLRASCLPCNWSEGGKLGGKRRHGRTPSRAW